MDQIQHRHIQVRGLNLHIAEIGAGSGVVLLLHGFPEIWYTWRHQMVGLANGGFKVIAPDFRGYGLSDKPLNPENTTFLDLVHDLLGIIDHLSISKIFLIAKDFGTKVACLFTLYHSERVRGLITIGAPYIPPGSSNLLGKLPDGCYISVWQEPGRAEADFGRFDAKTVVRKIYTLFSRSNMPIVGENQQILEMVGPSTPLPPWLSEEDMDYYGSSYEKSGFETALQVPYRSLHEEHKLPDLVLKLPVMTIIGLKDYSGVFRGLREYIESGKVNEFVPNLEIVNLPEGTHFMPEQLPEIVNKLILDFLAKHV